MQQVKETRRQGTRSFRQSKSLPNDGYGAFRNQRISSVFRIRLSLDAAYSFKDCYDLPNSVQLNPQHRGDFFLLVPFISAVRHLLTSSWVNPVADRGQQYGFDHVFRIPQYPLVSIRLTR
jgi:hypothetical protein